MIEDDDDVGEGTSNHEVMGISSYRDHKTTSSFLNSMSNSHAAGDGTSGTGFFQFPHQQNTFHGYEPSTAVYDSAGMLSEMFDFGAGGRQSAPVELLNHQISGEHLFFTKPSPPPIQDHNFHSPQFTWIPEGTTSGAVAGEAQGLSLSLASTAQEMMFFNSGAGQEPRHHFGFGAPSSSSSVFSLSAVNVLRNSKFTRPAQELLEEFCSVGRGGHNQKKSGGGSGGVGNSDTKEPPALSPAERMEHQRRKVKLTTMLDEVERRYSHYCEQLQMVVNSYEMVMGFGAAVPYTALAQKAMSRHFRCLKDGVQGQLRHSCEVLGEKDLAGGIGITKGETPRLKMLEQNLRKQRAFHQMGIMEQEAWRPQRGLPERSVNILRAWLFEHFLHPYPSDADKHLLARQTGLSRNQVANWFINARVRLWKPMIEEMYQKESKEVQEDEDNDEDNNNNNERESTIRTTQTPTLLPPLPSTSSSSAPTTTQALAITDKDPSPSLFVSSESTHHHHRHHHPITAFPTPSYSDAISLYGTTSSPAGNSSTSGGGVGPTMIRFGTTTPSSGDVSLTLGLRHGAAARNPDPDKTGFSFTDFH